MSIYDRLAERVHPVVAHEQETSYFSAPETELDPRLFDGTHLKANVRRRLLSIIHAWMHSHGYAHSESWLRVWLAGSGVSFQWAAARDPGDLDVLLGVDFVGFRRANTDLQQLSDVEIARHINKQMQADLWPKTRRWAP